jgi:hypothetical protein
MKLRRREKPKKDQALHALASATKVWSEWQLAKRAGKGVAKAKELKPSSKATRRLSTKWVKIGGGAAVVGGAAAAVARKLRGKDPEIYTGPPPSAAVEAAKAAGETVTPLNLAPDPATQPATGEPASGPSALRHVRDGATEEAAQAPAPAPAGDAPKAGDLVADPAPAPEPEPPAPEPEPPAPEPEPPEPEPQPVAPIDDEDDDRAAPTVVRETPAAEEPSDDAPADAADASEEPAADDEK